MTQQLSPHCTATTLFDLTDMAWPRQMGGNASLSAGQGALRLKVPVQLMTRPLPALSNRPLTADLPRTRKRKASFASILKQAMKTGAVSRVEVDPDTGKIVAVLGKPDVTDSARRAGTQDNHLISNNKPDSSETTDTTETGNEWDRLLQ